MMLLVIKGALAVAVGLLIAAVVGAFVGTFISLMNGDLFYPGGARDIDPEYWGDPPFDKLNRL